LKKTPAIFFLGLAALLPARAADSGKGLQDFQDERMFGQSIPNQRAKEAARPTPDARRIINQSSSFLKEREPEMTEEEGAIYEKLSGMLANNVDLAVKMLQGMVNEKVPPSPAFDFILGNAYYTSNQLDRAEELYRRAVKRYPSFLRAWNNLGIAYYTQNRFSEASPCFAKAVSLGDRDPVMLGLLGYSLEAQGDFVAAETAYLQAVAGDPENVDSKTGLLRIFVAGRQYARAEPVARFLLKAKPTEAHSWLDYAGILLAQGRKVEAMVVLEEADDSGVAGPDEWELLGDLLAEQSLAPEAVKAYRSEANGSCCNLPGYLSQLVA
jgi:predicted Zn-dependent protease